MVVFVVVCPAALACGMCLASLRPSKAKLGHVGTSTPLHVNSMTALATLPLYAQASFYTYNGLRTGISTLLAG